MSEVERVAGVFFHVPLDLAATPTTGPCIANSWWSVHPEKGVAFYGVPTGPFRTDEPCPQCNQDEGTSRLLGKRLTQDHETRFLPVVFMRHAERAFAALRNEALARKRAHLQETQP